MYTCAFRINANLVKEGSVRINAKLVKEELNQHWGNRIFCDVPWLSELTLDGPLDVVVSPHQEVDHLLRVAAHRQQAGGGGPRAAARKSGDLLHDLRILESLVTEKEPCL